MRKLEIKATVIDAVDHTPETVWLDDPSRTHVWDILVRVTSPVPLVGFDLRGKPVVLTFKDEDQPAIEPVNDGPMLGVSPSREWLRKAMEEEREATVKQLREALERDRQVAAKKLADPGNAYANLAEANQASWEALRSHAEKPPEPEPDYDEYCKLKAEAEERFRKILETRGTVEFPLPAEPAPEEPRPIKFREFF